MNKFIDNEFACVRIFWFLIVAFILSLFISLMNNFLNMEIPYFASVLEDMTINVQFRNKVSNNDFLICFNDFCTQADTDKFNNVFSVAYSSKNFPDEFSKDTIKRISITYRESDNDKIKNNIENIYLYSGSRTFSYDSGNISGFKIKNFKIKLSNNDSYTDHSAIIIPNDYKTNYKGVLNHLSVMFLFLFYGWKHFLLSYLLLFCAFCTWLYNKNKIGFKINHWAIFSIIMIIAVILRINLITYYPLWLDELYTKTIAIETFKNCFSDAGNPPLFYILEFIISKLAANSDLILKIPSFVIGVLFSPCVYLLFKNIDKNLALFAAFFASINTINIYHSQEIRSSALCMLISVLAVYFLFLYLKKQNTLNLIYYSIISILAINTHYYLAIFIFTNFLYILFKLKDKNEKIKFTLSSALCSLTFVVYLLISFKTASNATFNTWIGTFNHYKFIYAIKEFFINKYIFIFFIILLIINIALIYLPRFLKNKFKIKIDDNKKELLLYLLYSITAILVIVSIISLLIKPIFHKRLCISIYSLLFLSEILLISTVCRFKNFSRKILALKMLYSAVVFFIFIYIVHPMPLRQICRISEYIDFVNYDCKKYISQGYEIHGVMTDYADYLKNFPKILSKNIVWHIISGNQGKYLINIKKDNFTRAKKAVIYVNTIGVEFKDAVVPYENAYIFHTNSISNARIIYDN